MQQTGAPRRDSLTKTTTTPGRHSTLRLQHRYRDGDPASHWSRSPGPCSYRLLPCSYGKVNTASDISFCLSPPTLPTAAGEIDVGLPYRFSVILRPVRL